MNKFEFIIIGAGAAGLAAASRLSRETKNALVLEARNRTGGRIYTCSDNDFKEPAELGAEFIHGKLPFTFALLKEYGIGYYDAQGEVWQVYGEEPEKKDDFVTGHRHELTSKLKGLEHDIPLQQFLDENFAEDKYRELRAEITGFAEGYESADMKRFSTFAFRKDWLEAEDWEQYRIKGGYAALINAMADECMRNGCNIRLSAIVEEIQWKRNEVFIKCTNGEIFNANKVLITVPLGVIQEEKISFCPVLPQKIEAARQLGCGNVIKVHFIFREKFWESELMKKQFGRDLAKVFFIFSDEAIPTWWTQYPSATPLLTAWISGSKAKERTHKPDEEIFEEAFQSLSRIFKLDASVLREKLIAHKVANWSSEPFSLGSYTYATVDAEKYASILALPVEDTLFFAGEALSLNRGGMVEDAIESGLKVAEKLTAR